MKKTILLTITIAILLTLPACGRNNSSEGNLLPDNEADRTISGGLVVREAGAIAETVTPTNPPTTTEIATPEPPTANRIGTAPTFGGIMPIPSRLITQLPLYTPHVLVENYQELLDAVSSASNTHQTVVGLAADIQLESTLVIPVGTNIALTSASGQQMMALIAAGCFDAVLVEYGASLFVDNITIDRQHDTNGRGIQNRGETIFRNGVITNQANDAKGGGIYNAYGAQFTLLQGFIAGNRAAYGGAVSNHGRLYVYGGYIYNNIATVSGGGLHTSTPIELRGGVLSNNMVVRE